MSILTDIVPAAYRRHVYSAYFLAVSITGALTAGKVGVGVAPDVLAYIGGALGLVAASNTPSIYEPRHKDA